MKTLLARILSIAVLCLPVCELRALAPAPKVEKPAARDGSSYKKAIVVKSVAAEYKWLRKKHPGHKVRMQSLQMKNGKPFDVLAITTKDGKDMDVFFDISSFFGK